MKIKNRMSDPMVNMHAKGDKLCDTLGLILPAISVLRTLEIMPGNFRFHAVRM